MVLDGPDTAIFNDVHIVPQQIASPARAELVEG